MVLTLHNLATKYNCLPTEALARASTFDLYVLDIATKWEEVQYQKSQGLKPATKIPSQAELQKMFNSVKEQERKDA